jgi:hypothetical protein
MQKHWHSGGSFQALADRNLTKFVIKGAVPQGEWLSVRPRGGRIPDRACCLGRGRAAGQADIAQHMVIQTAQVAALALAGKRQKNPRNQLIARRGGGAVQQGGEHGGHPVFVMWRDFASHLLIFLTDTGIFLK